MSRLLPPAGAVHAETPLRPRQPVARRHRGSTWQNVLAGLRVTAVLVAPLLATGWLATSPVFALRSVEILGGDRIEREWVDARLADLVGRHLLTINRDDVAARLATHPWFADVAIRKQLPDQLTVELREREPIVVSRRGDSFAFVDPQGHEIAPWTPTVHAGDLPIVAWQGPGPVPVAEALTLLAELEGVEPRWAAELSELELLGNGDARIVTAAVPWRLVVRRGRIADGLGRLDLLLPELAARGVFSSQFDLRFDKRVVVEPQTRPVVDGARAEDPDGTT